MNRNSKAGKDLVLLAIASTLAYFFAALFGGFDALEKLEKNNGLSKVHPEELILILVILGFATTIFFLRRYKEFHEEISERKESEQIMRESRTQALLQQKDLEILFQHIENVKKEWERMLDSVGDMVVLSYIGGNINRCNRAFMEFVGRSYEEILGKNLESLLKEQGIEVSDLDVQTLNGYFKAKGKWFGLKSYPFKDIVTGDITGAVILIHDESIPPTAVEFREDGN